MEIVRQAASGKRHSLCAVPMSAAGNQRVPKKKTSAWEEAVGRFSRGSAIFVPVLLRPRHFEF
jgi:hypothetical protein